MNKNTYCSPDGEAFIHGQRPNCNVISQQQRGFIGDYITVPDCAPTGTVKAIKVGVSGATGQDRMLFYEIETEQGQIRIQGTA